MPPIDRRLSSVLDFARWASAAMVVLSHVRPLLFVDHGSLTSPSAGLTLLYFLTGFGREAVVVFFVISGLLVGGTALDRLQRGGGFALRAYLVARFVRIYSVYLPALLLGALCDHVGRTWFDGSGLYTRAPSMGIESLAAPMVSDLIVALGNLLMLQGIAVPTFGSNGPLWSLSYEWWYYVAAAAALTGLSGRHRVAAAVALGGVLVLMSPTMRALGLLWLLGCGVVPARRAGWPVPRPAVALAVFVLVLAALRVLAIRHDFGYSTPWLGIAKSLLLGIATAAVFLACRGDRALPGGALHRHLADFSFTLYLVHFPLMLLIAAMAHDRLGITYRRQPDAAGLAWMATLVALLYAAAWLLARLTERHTPRWREWLMARRPRPVGPGDRVVG